MKSLMMDAYKSVKKKKKCDLKLCFIPLLSIFLCAVFVHVAGAHPSHDSVKLVSRPVLLKTEGGYPEQVIIAKVWHESSSSKEINIYNGEVKVLQDSVYHGENYFKIRVAAVRRSKEISLDIKIKNESVIKEKVSIDPVRKKFIYILPHSHNDIGYSDLQPNVEKEQNANTRLAMKLIRETKDYPKGAQFKWNIESLWALENFFKIASDSEKRELVRDVKEGYIGLSAGYCNELTGVCRPEELYHLLDYSRKLNKEYGIEGKTYMISDVPGMNWSVIPEFAKRGVRYISDAPNYATRIGNMRKNWGDKPFYWVSPSGEDSILFWMAGKGYSYFIIVGRLDSSTSHYLIDYMQELEDKDYPYDMVQLRYEIKRDNGPPDTQLPHFVKRWNEKYASPRLVIATMDEMMRKFERKYGTDLPTYKGTLTPYWEDGVMSTAKYEVLAKHGVERLLQAEKLHGQLSSTKDDSLLFSNAWRSAILWHEHTWGAYTSISHPDSSFTMAQWAYKKQFALDLDSLSKKILRQWVQPDKISSTHSYKVYNTSNWKRSNLVSLTQEQSTAGDGIIDRDGHHYPTQRLHNGKLVFLAKDVPALGEKTFYNVADTSKTKSQLKVGKYSLENRYLKIILDPVTGSIRHLINKRDGIDYVDTSTGLGLNEYLYMSGADPKDTISIKQVHFQIKEKGPLIISLQMTSKAPGAHQLIQEIRLVKGVNKVEVINKINKKKIRTKESVHFAYPIHVPGGEMSIDLGKAVMWPGINQLSASNMEFTGVQRWIDISNDDYGITITTEESPLIEIGALVNEMARQKEPNNINTWRKNAVVSNTFYFYVMNNYWMTNYKADQEGWVTFHYTLHPHNMGFNKDFSYKKGIESCQPLLLTPLY